MPPMAKTSSKESIARLVKICALKGIQHVVISPGSRNAPLTLSFAENSHFNCLNIPDERVAAFYAMGMAQRLASPVIICCTSGSAALNYAPAIAEAYYQKIPLVVLTADRPVEWLDQRAGQTMRQKDVFKNYIKKSFEIIQEASSPEHLWYNDRIVNEAINMATTGAMGPVHINVPLREPLYDLVPEESIPTPKIIHQSQVESQLTSSSQSAIMNQWREFSSVLVIIGQKNLDPLLDKEIEELAQKAQVVILTETTSNVRAKHVFPSIDRVIDSIAEKEYQRFTPELVISCGAAIVSKKIRFMLRAMNIKAHWHVDPHDGHIDTYQALTNLINVRPIQLFKLLNSISNSADSIAPFKQTWIERESITKQAHNDYLQQASWSDLLVISKILESIPSGTLHLASSTPIRYAQLFDHRNDLDYKSNRGISGIDGCTSTAMGYAMVHEDMVTLLTGDIAFFYDSNALWHHHVPSNVRIILINNEGGNIFRYVKGPDQTDHLEQHFEATHSTSAEHIVKGHNLNYFKASNEVELAHGMEALFDPKIKSAGLLEVYTPRLSNIDILKDYFQLLKQ